MRRFAGGVEIRAFDYHTGSIRDCSAWAKREACNGFIVCCRTRDACGGAIWGASLHLYGILRCQPHTSDDTPPGPELASHLAPIVERQL